MGNYGNKLDADMGAACSVTEQANPVFDGEFQKVLFIFLGN